MRRLNFLSKRGLGALGVELTSLYGLSKKDARLAETVFTTVSVRSGTELAWEGSGVKQLVLLLDGEVEVTRDGDHLATLHRGDVLGEITALGLSVNQTASAVATRESRIAVAGSKDIAKISASRELTDMLMAHAERHTLNPA